MEDLPPFWEEDCLSGSIDQNPFSIPPQSLFDSDLFCGEEIVQAPGITPESALESLENENFAASVPSPQGFPYGIPITPPQQTVPPAVSPSPPFPESSQRGSPWRSFFDDGCPLRRRVKVTIAPQTLGKRVVPPTASPKASKKPRLSPSQSTPQDNQQGPRLTQTTLRLPDPTECPGRITLHVPYKSDPTTGNQIMKQANKNPNNQINPSSPTNDSLEEEEIDIQPTVKDVMASNRPLELDTESDLDEPFCNPISANEADETMVLPLFEQGGSFLPYEMIEEPCAELPDITSNQAVGNLPHLGQVLKEVRPVRRHGVPAMRRAARNNRECISSELNKRIANISLPDKAPDSIPPHTDPVHLQPLVNTALQAMSRAAQKYKSLINKVGSVQPAAAIVESLMNSAHLASSPKSDSRNTKANSVAGGKIGKGKAGRRKGRRKRATANNSIANEAPNGKATDGPKSMLSDEFSPLSRYIKSQSRLLGSTL